MTDGGLLVVLGLGRVLNYLGFVLFAGVLFCWALGLAVSGGERLLLRLRRLGLITVGAGAVLNLVAAAGLIANGPITSSGAGAAVSLDLIGGGALAGLAVLAGTLFLLPDLTRPRPSPARRFLALLIVGVLALTLIVSAPVIRREHWVLITWAAAWELIGLAALVGACVILIVLAGSPGSGDRAIDLDRARVTIRLGSVVVGIAAIATLVIDLANPTGTGTGWAMAKIIGVAVMIALLLFGTRRLSALEDRLLPRLLGAGLAVGAVVMIISSWLPDRLV